MFPLLVALTAVAGLVRMAVNKAEGPAKKPYAEREKLDRLKMKSRFTLDEAEDGLVLARRYGDKKAEVRFSLEVKKLRKLRPRF